MLATHDDIGNDEPNSDNLESPEHLPASSGKSSNPPMELNLQDLVDRIQAGEPSGMEDLYRIFSKGVRFYLCRQLGAQELEDKVHDTFVIVVQAIRRGDLREPDRLMGFIRTVVRRQVAAHIDVAIQTRREHMGIEGGPSLIDASSDPEENYIVQQKAELMEKILGGMPKRDREILTRFYLDEQPQDQICREMSLSETQFRLLKSRAKSRFGELGKKKLFRKPIQSVFLRRSASA